MGFNPRVFIGKKETRVEVYNYENNNFRAKIFIPKRTVDENGLVEVRGQLFKIHLKVKEEFKRELVLEVKGQYKLNDNGDVRIRDAAKFVFDKPEYSGTVILYAKCYIPYHVRKSVRDKMARA